MKRTKDCKKAAPSSMGMNASGTLNLRSRAVAAKVGEVLRAVLAARGPIATVDLWHLLGGPACLSCAQIRRLLKKARDLRAETLSCGGVTENMYGLRSDRRWKSAMQAFLADRRKASSERAEPGA